MKPYQYYCDQVGLDRNAYKSQPEILREFVIYVDRVATTVSEQVYDMHKGAKEIIKDGRLHKAFWDKQRELEQQAIDLWLVDLRAEYTELSDGLFILCYNEAYDREHSSGFDMVGLSMKNIVDFAEKVIKLAAK